MKHFITISHENFLSIIDKREEIEFKDLFKNKIQEKDVIEFVDEDTKEPIKVLVIETFLSSDIDDYDHNEETFVCYEKQNNKFFHLRLILFKDITPAFLTDNWICPTCFNKKHNNFLYGNDDETLIYKNKKMEVFLVGNPRAQGHIAISSVTHYKDMMDIPDDLCSYIFVFAKALMNSIKEIYKCESVYLCTMCDGPMNHFHIQLIPRYKEEKRGSINFVKARLEYIYNEEKVTALRNKVLEIVGE